MDLGAKQVAVPAGAGGGVDVNAFARQYAPNLYEQHYVHAKLSMDPLYNAVYSVMKGRTLPLLDVGCGMGVLAFYLRQRGYEAPVHGIDYDTRKILAANRLAQKYPAVTFQVGDARELPEGFAGDVTILDILQFFTDQERDSILANAANLAKAAGGQVVIRQTVRDDSFRYRVTRACDRFAKLTFWMKDAPTTYPTLEQLAAPFRAAGFQEVIQPCWGSTPFNNYLLVFTGAE